MTAAQPVDIPAEELPVQAPAAARRKQTGFAGDPLQKETDEHALMMIADCLHNLYNAFEKILSFRHEEAPCVSCLYRSRHGSRRI